MGTDKVFPARNILDFVQDDDVAFAEQFGH